MKVKFGITIALSLLNCLIHASNPNVEKKIQNEEVSNNNIKVRTEKTSALHNIHQILFKQQVSKKFCALRSLSTAKFAPKPEKITCLYGKVVLPRYSLIKLR